MTTLEQVKKIVELLESKKGEEVKALEIGKISSLGDYFVLASGSSAIQVRAMADAVEEGLSKLGIEPRRVEGYQSAAWIVLDYADILVHIFLKEMREFYALERVWADAPAVVGNAGKDNGGESV